MGSSGRSGQPSPSRRTGQGRPHPCRSRCGWRLQQGSDLRLWMSNRASFLEGRPLSARQHLRAGKSERRIENDVMAGANLHQCDRPKLLPESASCPALAQIGKVTPALQPARGMDASRTRTGQYEQADANAQVTLERCATGTASCHASPRVAARDQADGRASTRKPGSGVAGSGRLHVCRRVTACVHRSLERLGPAPGPRAGSASLNWQSAPSRT
jgi:hypothetical protein